MRAAVIACGALAADVRLIAGRRGWEVDVYPVDALLHNRPALIARALERSIQRLNDYDRLAVAYGDCGTYGAIDSVLAGTGIPRLAGNHCYDVLARVEVEEALREQPGTYFLTDFLARTFERTVVRELGLDRHPELVEDYFRNYMRVLWLAQRPTAATRAAAERAAARIGLPMEERDVGSEGLERQLEWLVNPHVRVADDAVDDQVGVLGLAQVRVESRSQSGTTTEPRTQGSCPARCCPCSRSTSSWSSRRTRSGSAPVCTSALTSVPTAPPSSGLTCSHDPVANPGVEIWAPSCDAWALLCTCQPPSPTVVVRADALAAVRTASVAATSSAGAAFQTATLTTCNSLPFPAQASPDALLGPLPAMRSVVQAPQTFV
jgi:hypothetical protein